MVETRLWIRSPAGWVGAQYVWNDDTSEARLSVVGKKLMLLGCIPMEKIVSMHIERPNQNQCSQCHEMDKQSFPLGPVHAVFEHEHRL
ncbi:MAG: hypothetical protein R3C56_30905 [Pirellulaceae bacterium]